MTLDELNKLYSDSEQVDQELFAEQRSNILLVAGDHFTKKQSSYWNRIRDARDLSSETKLRLTKNHIQKITKNYVNNLVTYAPGVTVIPNNEKELQDQKAAELHSSVWQDIKTKQEFNKKIYLYAKDFVEFGECFVKVFWDKNKGTHVGFEAEMDEMGQPVVDPQTGQMVKSDRPVFSGSPVFERIYAFDVLRAKEAKTIDESPFLTIRKMADIQTVKAMVGGDEQKLKAIQDSKDETYNVFDGNQGFTKSDDKQCMIKETYFRPCYDYPSGYYYIYTSQGIIFEGELPLGIFPLHYVGFDEVSTSPRCRSIIKQLRPYQAEINRTASKIAETQITLGDDKLLIQDGTKITPGGQVPGVRSVKYTGMTPTVLPGRSGDQYVGYMNSQIAEMYQVANVEEDSGEKNAQVDPTALLFQTLKQKKRYSLYASKFESFLIGIARDALEITRAYIDDSALISIVGKQEQVNIKEFKNSTPMGYQIKVEAQTDDIETKLGKQITLTQLMQYVGSSLGKEDIGKMMRLSPYLNKEQMFSDMLIDYDNATNDILALDRGEIPDVNEFDDHEYALKRLSGRMKQADYKFLPPQIKQNYQDYKSQHEMILGKQNEAIASAKSEWIPTSGYMVVCDLYVSDVKDPMKTRRARVPYDALSWLIKKLEVQGSALDKLEQQNPQVQAELAGQAMGAQGQGSPMQQSVPGQAPQGASSTQAELIKRLESLQPMASQKGIMNV